MPLTSLMNNMSVVNVHGPSTNIMYGSGSHLGEPYGGLRERRRHDDGGQPGHGPGGDGGAPPRREDAGNDNPPPPQPGPGPPFKSLS